MSHTFLRTSKNVSQRTLTPLMRVSSRMASTLSSYVHPLSRKYKGTQHNKAASLHTHADMPLHTHITYNHYHHHAHACACTQVHAHSLTHKHSHARSFTSSPLRLDSSNSAKAYRVLDSMQGESTTHSPTIEHVRVFMDNVGVNIDQDLALRALTHRSSVHDHLGLLGKRTLNMFMTERVIEVYGHKYKADTLKSIVKYALDTEQLVRVTENTGLRNAITVSKGRRDMRGTYWAPEFISDRVVQSAFFAFVGAVYSTQGPAEVQRLVSNLLFTSYEDVETVLKLASPAITLTSICRTDNIADLTATATTLSGGLHQVDIKRGDTVIASAKARSIKTARTSALSAALQSEPFATRMPQIPLHTEMGFETLQDLNMDTNMRDMDVIVAEKHIAPDEAGKAHVEE
ncbi:hypothetical protein SARC_06570 [Sphaeroforma arctica JP610]|uniref:RNase III domain-containing protein n=1 Tax=Sphaeroforma arctica JP610 TaxID=667725 RepID=A0A0L0FW94_9EUKA|nr:hypothetical protein SARC_06570 [Sphaeroforma arctica JP610]KNC81090.1 hypothetical protein SARC_06570 [Sphaeroforma arctica JP610]|eukprot:XP_014154992.1 hypothetical protein SARC_06570 [Sphaeroforma arctica JP610]